MDLSSSDDDEGAIGSTKLQYNMNDQTGTIIRIQEDFGLLAFRHDSSANPEMYAFFDQPLDLITPGSLYTEATFDAQYLDDAVSFPQIGTSVRWMAFDVEQTGRRLEPVVVADPFAPADQGIREVDLVYMSLSGASACDVYAAEEKDVQRLKEVTDRLNFVCRHRDPLGKTDMEPVVKGMYAAKFSGSDQWGRIMLTGLPSADSVDILYLDSGETGTVPLSAIVPIQDPGVPFFCRRFRMIGCGDAESGRGRKKARQMIHKVFQEPVVKGVTCTFNGNMLLDVKYKRDRSLAETLLTKGHLPFDQTAWCLALVHQLGIQPPPQHPIPIQDALHNAASLDRGFIGEDGVLMVTRSPPVERKKEFRCPSQVVKKKTESVKLKVPDGDMSFAVVYSEMVQNKGLVKKVRDAFATELDVTRTLIDSAPSDDTSELQILLTKIEWLQTEAHPNAQPQLIEDIREFVRRFRSDALDPVVRSLYRLENFVPGGGGDSVDDLGDPKGVLDELEEERARVMNVTEEAVAKVQKAFDDLKNMETPSTDDPIDLTPLMIAANDAITSEIRILTRDLSEKRIGLIRRTYEGLKTKLQLIMEQKQSYEHFVDVLRAFNEQ